MISLDKPVKFYQENRPDLVGVLPSVLILQRLFHFFK